MNILTKYENNNGSTENCLNQSKEVLEQRIVDHVDIALDQCAPHHFKVGNLRTQAKHVEMITCYLFTGGRGLAKIQEL